MHCQSPWNLSQLTSGNYQGIPSHHHTTTNKSQSSPATGNHRKSNHTFSSCRWVTCYVRIADACSYARSSFSTTIHTIMKSDGAADKVLLTSSLLLGLTLAFYLAKSYTTNGLNRYPGPWLAKFSKLWLRLDVKANQHQRHLLELHHRHGDVVRIGPNHLSISSPDLVSTIYGVKDEFLKV